MRPKTDIKWTRTSTHIHIKHDVYESCWVHCDLGSLISIRSQPWVRRAFKAYCDQAHNRKKTGHRTRINRKDNTAVDNSLALPEARSGALEEENQRNGDCYVGDHSEYIDGTGQVDESGKLCESLKGDGSDNVSQ